MATVYLKDYLKRISDTYVQSREKIFVLTEQLKQLNDNWKKELTRGWANNAQYQQANDKHLKKQRELKKSIQEARDEANKKISDLSNEADKIFSNHYRPHASQVDLQAIELLKSGVLSNRELEFLAEDYKDNSAMSKILLSYIKEKCEKDHNLTSLQAKISTRTKPFTTHTESINALRAWGDRTLQDDFVIAQKMVKHFDENVSKIIENCGECAAETADIL